MQHNTEGLLLELEDAVFLERTNRFSAWVMLGGEKVAAHVPNSGRLRELLVPGARVRVRPGGIRTQCRLMMVEHGGRWALIDSHMTNDILEHAVRSGWIVGEPRDIRREVRFRESRLDMGLHSGDGVHLIEAKCVTLVREGVALFPDAPTLRGTRHLRELIGAVQAGFHGHVAFFVQQPGAECFAPNRETDPAFAQTLAEAQAAGVRIHVIECRVFSDRVELKRPLPVKESL